ncbi:MAG: replication initiation protein [Candidatus Omnitrophota bacterium]
MANEMVKYHNNLVEAIYSFDLLPKKLLLGAICQVHDDGERLTVKESAKEFCERVGIDYRADHTHLKAAAMVLLKATIQMQMPDKADWHIYQMMIEAKHEKGVIEFEFHRRVRPFIAELKERFTQYKIANIRPLSSQFSVRIYELLAQYRNTENQYREFVLEDLKKIIGCENKFKNYSHFRKYVILKAEEELRANCDLYFTFVELKQPGSKKVTGIRFRLLYKKIGQIEQSEDVLPGMPPPTTKERTENEKHMALELELRRQGMDHPDFEEFFKECGGFDAVHSYCENKLKNEKDYISKKMGGGLIRKKILENAKREWDLSRLEQERKGERQRLEAEAVRKRDEEYFRQLEAK